MIAACGENIKLKRQTPTINEIIWQIFLKTNMEEELVSVTGKELQIVGPAGYCFLVI